MVQQEVRALAEIGTHDFSRTKRTNDAERCKRVHDSKFRTIGVDKDALDAQVREKENRRQLADKEARAHAEATLSLDRRLQLLDQVSFRQNRA